MLEFVNKSVYKMQALVDEEEEKHGLEAIGDNIASTPSFWRERINKRLKQDNIRFEIGATY